MTAIATPSNSPTAQMQGISGLFGSLLGHAPGVFLLAVGGGIAAAAVAAWLGTVAHRRPDLFEPSLCAAVALSLFASPHLLGHDLTLLAPVLVAGLAWLAGRPGERLWPGTATLARARDLGAAVGREPRRPLPEHRRVPGESDPVGAAAHRRHLVRAGRRTPPVLELAGRRQLPRSAVA